MARPITWRNVASGAASAGSSALSAAAGFFGGAQRGGQDIIKKAREQDVLDKEALTQKTLGAVFANNELTQDEIAGLPEGVDIGSILDRAQTNKINTANIARNVAATRVSELQSSQAEFEQSPEQRKIVAEQQAAEAADRRTTIGLRQQELNFRLEGLKREQDQDKAILASNELYLQYADEAGADYDAAMPGLEEAYAQNNPGDAEGLANYMEKVRENREAHVQNAWAENLSDAEREMLRLNPNLTPESITKTRIGQDVATRTELGVARRKKIQDMQIEQAGFLKKASHGATNFMVRGPGGEWTAVASNAAATANLLNKTDALGVVQGMTGLSGEDSKEAMAAAKVVLDNVKGNRDAFKSIFESDQVVKSTAVFGNPYVDWNAAKKKSKNLGSTIVQKAAAQAQLKPGQSAFVSLEALQREAAGQTADREFLAEQRTSLPADEPVDITQIANALVSEDTVTQDQGVAAIKKGVADITNSLANIPKSSRARFKPQVQAIENALAAIQRAKSTDNAINAFQEAQKQLQFLQRQSTQIEAEESQQATEARLLKSLQG